MEPTEEEINEQLNEAAMHHENGTRWPGMSYEEGVESALLWVTGQSDHKPMDD